MPASNDPSNQHPSHEDIIKKLQGSMRLRQHQPASISSPKPTPAPKAAEAKAQASTPVEIQESSQTQGLSSVEYPSRALYLINAWRIHGHLHAKLDPLQQQERRRSPDMELAYYGLDDNDLDKPFPTGDLIAPTTLPLRDILDILSKTYCGHIGPELMHISNTARKQWFQHRLEKVRSTPQFEEEKRKLIFRDVMKAEEFERFLHTRYTGQKRFSLEGGETLIPMLNTMIQHAGSKGVKEIIMGMAHRGRLNVLANVMNKSLSDIFAEFEGNQFSDAETGAGDVKYHMGFSSDIETSGGAVHISLGFNPSHLEIISPVVLGSVRARQCRRKDDARREVLGVLIHGDAAFAGQGVVAESLNLGDLSGYRTGGTIHVVVNNQIGFTTNPFDARSTLNCTDVAKLVQAPILHVNGDDPEACCMAMELAMDYRHQFHGDVVIDLVCYRRLGHNEADAPEVTQPKMYERIRAHESVQHIYRKQLIAAGLYNEEETLNIAKSFREALDAVRKSNLALPQTEPNQANSLKGRWAGYINEEAAEPDTTSTAETLLKLIKSATKVPDGFVMHPKVQGIYDSRIEMMEGKTQIDWGCAEIMAYATLLDEGGWVRLSGQDSGRGTFFHRHAIVYDQETGKAFTPLRQLINGELSRFLVIDSMLSEMAVLGYEYGYSVAEPRALVIWEAQYGDFANMAQVVIDQFIAAGESKWKRMSGLVLWLPHGFEGQGAEHSSARLERFLQLCADDNMQVVCPTTPAQLFHLLRRQYLSTMRKPLIMMAPKSMLRNKGSFSDLEDLTTKSFQPVLPEKTPATKASRRVVLCTGKVHFDLLEAREEQGIEDVHSIRLERLYPFPLDELKAMLQQEPYVSSKEVLWLQEEPLNQGAWRQIKHRLRDSLLPGQELFVLARPSLAAPAVGSIKRHIREKEYLVNSALAETTDAFLAYKMGAKHV